MAKMSLGGITFLLNPSEATIPRARRYVAWKETYSSVGFFSWGTIIAGQIITLKWPFMKSTQFASLDTLYMADAPVTWDPQDSSSRTWSVEIADFKGDYHIKLSTAEGNYRKNVEMTLLILAEG